MAALDTQVNNLCNYCGTDLLREAYTVSLVPNQQSTVLYFCSQECSWHWYKENLKRIEYSMYPDNNEDII